MNVQKVTSTTCSLAALKRAAAVVTNKANLCTITFDHVTKSTWQALSLHEINILLDALEEAFTQTPYEGYSIEFLEDHQKGPYIHLEGHGAHRVDGQELTGVPTAGHTPETCPFCFNSTTGLDLYQYEARLITSLSGRPLVIPSIEPIPVHWFQADRNTQVNLLQAAIEVTRGLQASTPTEKFHFELHCGSKGYQTVWHLHLRINREKKWTAT